MVAVLLHLLVLSAVLLAQQWSMQVPWKGVQHLARMLPEPPEVKIGRASPTTSAVAWIAYDDFRQLIAPEAPTEQPAIQHQVEPQPDAAMPLDPTPPGPPPQERIAPAVSPATRTDSLLAPPTAGAQQPALPLPPLVEGGDIALAHPADEPQPGSEPAPGRDDEHQQPQPDSPSTAAPASADPTAAPKADSESPPVRLVNDRLEVHPGSVITGPGIEIKTAIPRPGFITRWSTIPRNPTATLVFNRAGEVIQVTLERSTGYESWDGAVEASLYKWRATGPKLAELDRKFELDVEILFSAEEE